MATTLQACKAHQEKIIQNNHKSANSLIDDNDIGNETDRRIDPPINGQMCKDVVTEDMVRRKAFRWCQDSIGGAWLQLSSQEDIIIEPIG